MGHNSPDDDIGRMTVSQLLTSLRPAHVKALLSALAVVLTVTFALGVWVQKHILAEPRQAIEQVRSDQHISAWRQAVLKRNEFTASDWSNDWQVSFVSNRLREGYIQNILFLRDLSLPALQRSINELEVRLNALPSVAESSPAPDGDYSRRFREFRDSANKLVDAIEMGASGAGLEPSEIRAARGD